MFANIGVPSASGSSDRILSTRGNGPSSLVLHSGRVPCLKEPRNYRATISAVRRNLTFSLIGELPY
jgi:hypothetical protein